MENVYVHIWDGHSKVWCYEVWHEKVNQSLYTITYWGRIGKQLNELQSKKKHWNKQMDAQHYIQGKMEEKIRKGYVRIPVEEYRKYIREGDILGLKQRISTRWIRPFEYMQSMSDSQVSIEEMPILTPEEEEEFFPPHEDELDAMAKVIKNITKVRI